MEPLKLVRPEKLGHSHSRINTFVNVCELQYALTAILGYSPSGPAALRGQHVHAMLEYAANHYIKHGDLAEGFLQAAKLTSWTERKAEEPIQGPLDARQRQAYLDQAWPTYKTLTPCKAEMWFSEIFWPEPDDRPVPPIGVPATLPIRGKIDLIAQRGGELFVLDIKTVRDSNKMLPQYIAQRSPQLHIYALATGAERAGFLYLMQSRGQLVDVELSREELARTYLWLHRQIEAIEHRWRHGGWALAPRESGLCSDWCDHWSRCKGTGLGEGETDDLVPPPAASKGGVSGRNVEEDSGGARI